MLKINKRQNDKPIPSTHCCINMVEKKNQFEHDTHNGYSVSAFLMANDIFKNHVGSHINQPSGSHGASVIQAQLPKVKFKDPTSVATQYTGRKGASYSRYSGRPKGRIENNKWKPDWQNHGSKGGKQRKYNS